MTTSVTLPGNTGLGLVSREELVRGLNTTAMEIPTAGGLPFLKMDRGNGDFTYGQDETLVEDGSLWAANPISIRKGYVCWDSNAGGKPVQEFMVPYNRDLPDLRSLPELGMSAPNKKTGKSEQLEYQQQYSVEFTCVSGEDEGVTVEYKQSSGGAMKLFNKLINTIFDKAKAGNEFVPVGQLKNERYKNETYGGYTYNPLFEIVEWRTMDDTSPVGAEPEPAKEEAAAPAERAPRKRAAPAAAAITTEENTTAVEDVETQYAEEAAAEQTPRRRVRR